MRVKIAPSILSADFGRLADEVSAIVQANLTPFWRIQVRDVRSLGEDEGQLLGGASLIYEDECILAGIDISRRRIGSRDDPPDNTILFRIVLRNLGEIPRRGRQRKVSTMLHDEQAGHHE